MSLTNLYRTLCAAINSVIALASECEAARLTSEQLHFALRLWYAAERVERKRAAPKRLPGPLAVLCVRQR